MKILIAGVGALGSNLTISLAPDLKNKHSITILDNDSVEERNVQAATQHYYFEQIGTTKVSALEYNLYKEFGIDIQTLYKDIRNATSEELRRFDLIVDCFDNQMARKFLQDWWTGTGRNVLHIGFSAHWTFAIEWADHYKVPTDIKGMNICEMEGASSFVKMTAAFASLAIQEFIKDGKKNDFIGNKFSITKLEVARNATATPRVSFSQLQNTFNNMGINPGTLNSLGGAISSNYQVFTEPANSDDENIVF